MLCVYYTIEHSFIFFFCVLMFILIKDTVHVVWNKNMGGIPGRNTWSILNNDAN